MSFLSQKIQNSDSFRKKTDAQNLVYTKLDLQFLAKKVVILCNVQESFPRISPNVSGWLTKNFTDQFQEAKKHLIT